MSKYFVVCVVLLVLSLSGEITTAAPKWQSVHTGSLGFADGLVASPVAPYTKYVRTDVGGAYLWNESSSTWTAITDNLNAPGIESIAADPVHANTVYVAAANNNPYPVNAITYDDIFKSTNNGQTWTALGATAQITGLYLGPNDNFRNVGERLAIDPNNGEKTIYYGSRDQGLIEGTFSGNAWSWTAVSGLPAPNTTVRYGKHNAGVSFVVVDPSSGNATSPSQTIYVGEVGQGVWYTTDGGNSWTQLTGPPIGWWPERAAFDKSSKTLYVTYMTSKAGGNAWAAPNGGQVYELSIGKPAVNITPKGFGYGFGFCGISLDPNDASHLDVSPWPWAPSPTIDGVKQYANVFSYNLSAAKWTPITPKYIGIPSWWLSDTTNVWIDSVLIDPANSRTTWYSAGIGVLQSINADSASPTWTLQGNGIEELCENQEEKIPGIDNPLLSSCWDLSGFTYHSLTDGPASEWDNYLAPPDMLAQATGVDYSQGNSSNCVWVGYLEGHSEMIADGSGWHSTYPGLLYTSSDRGATWTPMTLPSETFPIAGGNVSIQAIGGSVALSATGSGNIVVAPQNAFPYPQQPWVWNASAKTWKQLSGFALTYGGLSNNAKVVASDNYGGNDCFYIYDGNDASIYFSKDGGNTWSKESRSGLPGWWQSSLKTQPGAPGHLWVGTRRNSTTTTTAGLYYSTNAGVSFTKLSNISSCSSFGFGKSAPGTANPTLFVEGILNAVTGMFQSTDLGKTWTNITPATGLPTPSVPGVDGDPDIFGKVYMGTGGRGLLYCTQGSIDVMVNGTSPSASTKKSPVVHSNSTVFTAPADTSTRTVVIHAQGRNSSGKLTAQLSDSSAPVYVNTIPLHSGAYAASYSITYNAALPGQTLKVTWSNESSTGNVTMKGQLEPN